MNLFGIVLAGLFGAVIGSFLNVLVVRIREASSIMGRSRCVHCGRTLHPKHLVPIISWLVLRGRCAFCQKPIHWQYPAVELAASILAMIAYGRHPFLWQPTEVWLFLFESFLTFDLLTLVTFDLRWQLLPIEFMGGSAILFGFLSILLGRVTLMSGLVGLIFGAGFLGIQVLISRGKWMGEGDPWMGALLGLTLGWPMIGISFYATYILGGCVAIVLLASGLAKRGARIAFAPLLAIGGVFTLWYGPAVLHALETLLHLT